MAAVPEKQKNQDAPVQEALFRSTPPYKYYAQVIHTDMHMPVLPDLRTNAMK